MDSLKNRKPKEKVGLAQNASQVHVWKWVQFQTPHLHPVQHLLHFLKIAPYVLNSGLEHTLSYHAVIHQFANDVPSVLLKEEAKGAQFARARSGD